MRVPLYRIAREVTDEVMGPGTYAALNRHHPDPQVRQEARMSDAITKPANMQALTYDVGKLLDRIQDNRDAHRGVYEQAMAGYRDAAVKFFGEQLERALEGKPFMTYFNEPMPEDHTEDYEAIIDLLGASEDTVVSLSIQEFRQYVRDDWGWKKEFTATASNYLPN